MNYLYTNFIGIDIGKFEFVVNVYGDKTTRAFKNTSEGAKQFYNDYKSFLDKGLVVCEVTGGYERLIIEQLQSLKIAVHRANGRQIKNFIRSYGIIGKNDNIDAKALSCYAYERQSKLELYERNAYEFLCEMSMRRNDLIKMRTAEKNRRAAPCSHLQHESFDAIINVINEQITLIENSMAEIIASDSILQLKLDALKTIPGIGDVNAVSIICHMPEIGTMNQKQVASLAGLAPHPNQSGARNGYRKTRGGRRQMRPILFFAALSSARSKSRLGEFYKHLIESGKPKMCAIIAVARKIVVIANARIKEALDSGEIRVI